MNDFKNKITGLTSRIAVFQLARKVLASSGKPFQIGLGGQCIQSYYFDYVNYGTIPVVSVINSKDIVSNLV